MYASTTFAFFIPPAILPYGPNLTGPLLKPSTLTFLKTSRPLYSILHLYGFVLQGSPNLSKDLLFL